MLGRNLLEESERQLTICNACRYCEGYCAVFPALEMRRTFTEGDVLYIAHLCHDCRACYYACMYSPPHEFAVNIPRVMSDVRLASYQAWSWPAFLARSFTKQRVGIALAGFATAFVIVLTVLGGWDRLFAWHSGPGAFYEVIPYLAMVVPALTLAFYGATIWLVGSARFWREAGGALGQAGGLRALAGAVREALTLRWLRGGGPGCYYPGAQASSVRRVFHSFVSYGFLSAFVSTTLAAIYQDFLHRLPPYPLTSAPVIFGSTGGVAMIVGCAGLIYLKSKSDNAPAGAGSVSLDYIFLTTLGLAALSGMLTLELRDTRAMGTMLATHLGLVAALLITAPYGKFVHFLYRSLALLRYRIEQDQLHRQR
jgi:citrate/tricarballylate utilization protein